MSELIWYHGKIGKEEAVRRFKNFHPDGSYLLRESGTVNDAYALSIGFQRNVYHYRIIKDSEDEKYYFEGREFYSLQQLVDYFQKNKGGLVSTLKHPILPPLGPLPNSHDRGYESTDVYMTPQIKSTSEYEQPRP